MYEVRRRSARNAQYAAALGLMFVIATAGCNGSNDNSNTESGSTTASGSVASASAGPQGSEAPSASGSSQLGVNAPGTAPGSSASTGPASTALKPSPDFTLPLLEGSGKLSLASLKGKVVLIDFWATWCIPCEQELPDFQKLYQKYKGQGLDVVAMTEEPYEGAAAFLKSKSITFPAVKADAAAVQAFSATSPPLTLLLNRQGMILKRQEGKPESSQGTTEQFWSPAIEAALKS